MSTARIIRRSVSVRQGLNEMGNLTELNRSSSLISGLNEVFNHKKSGLKRSFSLINKLHKLDEQSAQALATKEGLKYLAKSKLKQISRDAVSTIEDEKLESTHQSNKL